MRQETRPLGGVKRWYKACRLDDGISPCYIEVGDLRRTTSYNERVLTEKVSNYCLSEYAAEAMHGFQQVALYTQFLRAFPCLF